MDSLFLTVVNLSITASFAACIVFVLRGLTGRYLPRAFSYALWGIVLLRSLMPFSFSSAFSILGRLNPNVGQYGEALSQTYFPLHADGGMLLGQGAAAAQQTLAGGVIENAAVNGAHTVAEAAKQGWGMNLTAVCTAVWLLGAAALLVYSIVSYSKIIRRISTATIFKNEELAERCRVEAGLRSRFKVYVSERIESPFVCGVFNPKIILPAFLLDADRHAAEIHHILLHEMVHIKRFDFVLKPFAFLALTVHWFNPLMWLSFHLADRDMEMSCDEAVMKIAGTEQRGSYANTLLRISVKQNGLHPGSLLSFGESSIGQRVKNIVKYKNPCIGAVIASAALIALCGVLLLSNPIGGVSDKSEKVNVLFLGVLDVAPDKPQEVDATVLMSWDPKEKLLSVSSIPRDMVVETEEGTQRLRAYAGLHSPDQVAQTLSKMLEVEIPNYVKVNTAALRQLVDAIGGIDFDVPQSMYYDDPIQGLHISLEKGPQLLDGEKAEMLVRYRRYPGGDLTRIKVQRDLIAAMLTQKSLGGALKNMSSIYDLVSGNIETNMGKKELVSYAAAVGKAALQEDIVKEIEVPVSPVIHKGVTYLVLDKTGEFPQ